MQNFQIQKLTYCGLIMPNGVSEQCHHSLRQWPVTCMVPSHYRSQHCLLINFTPQNKLQWNLNQNTKILYKVYTFENVVCKMSLILFRTNVVSCQLLIPTSHMTSHENSYPATHYDVDISCYQYRNSHYLFHNWGKLFCRWRHTRKVASYCNIRNFLCFLLISP